MGEPDRYSLKEGTPCFLYSSDSTLYECFLLATPSGMVVRPRTKKVVTLIDKGGGEWLYLEDGDPHPLHVLSDTTITIQRNGIVYRFRRDEVFYSEWGDEVRDIITRETRDDSGTDTPANYMLSVREREQADTIHWLIIGIGLILLLAVQYIVSSQRSKRRLQLQLQQIREEHEDRAQSVRDAVKNEEKRFYASDEYVALQRRITDGQRLQEEDWSTVEQHLKKIYPGFTAQLRGLHPLSELEYQTCLLIKLRIAPKDIAAVLTRDLSTISTVRSRLYKKVFGQKGGARDWDDFILSIGT